MSPSPVSHEETLQISQLVAQSTQEVMGVLPVRSSLDLARAVGHSAGALTITEGSEAGNAFARDAITRFNIKPDEAVGIWADVYAEGSDPLALLKAHRAAGLIDGVLTPRGRITVDHFIDIAQTGDPKSMAIARELVPYDFLDDRPFSFGRLYKLGDRESLPRLIEAAREAKLYAESNKDPYYFERTERVLPELASFALKQGNVDDALAMMDIITRDEVTARLHADIFSQHGSSESLHRAAEYLKQESEPDYFKRPVELRLAAGGYAPALESVQQRVKERDRQRRRDGLLRVLLRSKHLATSNIEPELDDLVTLHTSGTKNTTKTVLERIRTSEHPEHYITYLGRVGLKAEQLALATGAYDADPSLTNAMNVLEVQHDNTVWQALFRSTLYKRENPWQAAVWIRNLARRVKG